MNPILLSISHLVPFSSMAPGPIALNAGLLTVGFAGLLLGMIFTAEPEDPTDTY